MTEDESSSLAIGGEFWLMERPEQRSRGEYRCTIGDDPEAILANELIPDPRVVYHRDAAGRITGSGKLASPARSVEAFQPVTLHGVLDSGLAVTLLDARNYGSGGWYGNPHYRAVIAMLGAHVHGNDQIYAAVRFRIDDPYWLGHLTAGLSSTLEDDGSTLSAEISDDGNWLVYVANVPTTLRRLETRVISGSLLFLHLAMNVDLVTRETQVRIEPSGEWVTLTGEGCCAEPIGMNRRTLLQPSVVTVNRLAKWITLNDRLDGLAWTVARPVEGPLQVQAQVATSAVEGLHRRLPYQQAKFPLASKSTIGGIKQAARRAAAEKASTAVGLDSNQVKAAVRNALSHFEEVDYLTRAEDLVDEVCSVIPEITESVPDLAKLLSRVRNNRAHQLPQETERTMDVWVNELIVVATTTPWLLRGLLLLHAGFEPSELNEAFVAHQRFLMFRANTAKHAVELGWTIPPKA
ncbi:hypothetical protein H7J08_13685 [Mycobacterium frederiksbergense]|uniref:HEPN domain-containing protein n=1 Tax=Mycobacteriaceae TaxID=1762 RepID=UPI0021F37034|nr:HEPN domain-containing protein [Mycolicibacterium frederiksbergense]MCV7045711.1 hypothetical protein [Mycolicibacterium frederiksbergense]